MFELFEEDIGARASFCDYLVALGTHPHMNEQQFSRLLGKAVRNGRCGSARIFNHSWEIPQTFVGIRETPVRTLIDMAAEMVTIPVACFSLVLEASGTTGIYFGTARDPWRMAAQHSAGKHIQWLDRPFQRVLSILPPMYDDLWTGAKGMYKAEPAIADGAEVQAFQLSLTQTGARLPPQRACTYNP